MKKSIIKIVVLVLTLSACAQNSNYKSKNKVNMTETKNEILTVLDHSRKSILARGCDPVTSLEFSKIVSPLIGNAEYVPTTDDADFVEQLKSRKWSIVFFAPGACRFSAAKRSIPGGNSETAGWTLQQYRELVYKLQGNEVQIIETMNEGETVTLLKNALKTTRETK
jgi:hypothetical protein